MGFFDDDPFEDIVREFFGGNSVPNKRSNTIISGEKEERVIDFIEDENYVYLIFEFPGYEEGDIFVSVKGRELQVKAKKHSLEKIQSYFSEKLNQGISVQKTLPRFINPKKFKYTIKNGVLEITFNKR